MSYWNSDEELFEIARRELFSALIGDVLDKIGRTHQFLPQKIKPLDPTMKIIGRAMPVLECDVFEESIGNSANALMEKPFGLMFQALDDIKPNEIYVCSGASKRYALWGGLMTARATRLGAAGAILDGYWRDTPELLTRGFPVFGLGSYAQDQGSRGKVVDYRVPVEIGGIRIEPGDVMFADLDGTIVVPADCLTDVFSRAIEKGRDEKKVLQALEEGMSTVDAFDRFGIM